MTNKDDWYKSFFAFFVFYLFVILFIFIFCILEAYGYDEGMIKTSSAKLKHEIIGYITFVSRQIGNNVLNNSKFFSVIFLPFSILVDALICAAFTKMLIELTNKLKNLNHHL